MIFGLGSVHPTLLEAMGGNRFSLRAEKKLESPRTISLWPASEKCTVQTHSLTDERPMFRLPGNSLMQRFLSGSACQETMQPLVE